MSLLVRQQHRTSLRFGRLGTISRISLAIIISVFVWVSLADADSAVTPGKRATTESTIKPGTAITASDWRNYQTFMPDGMVALFEGEYSWKMPADIQIEVAPTELHPLPRRYLEATEKYAGQVAIAEQPNGSLRLENYLGGIPFPNPQEPHRGW